jgi:elongation factor Ts
MEKTVAEISAQLVKELREKTGAGMMECKKALVEASADMEKAVEILRTRGLAAAAKKSARSTKQGVIGHLVAPDGKLAVLAEVNCESDFVARTEDFQGLVADVLEHVAAKAPKSVAELLEIPYTKDPSLTIAKLIAGKIAKVGENMGVARFERAAAATPNSEFAVYIHPGAQLGVLIELSAGKAETLARPELKELAHDVAMQVAAADPRFLNKADVTAEAMESEKRIQRERALAEGKPEKMVDKIVEGRMGKFYEEFCLNEQIFIKDNGVTVGQLLAQKGKELSDSLGIVRFVRYKVGETVADAPAEAAS